MTLKFHVFEFLQELLLFSILGSGFLSKMLNLLQVKRLLLIKFAL